jgi:mono/diheme cytochrome c family protein
VTVALIVLLALALTALVIVPMAVPGQTDPLPDQRDPTLQDLEEERDALLGAIRELDARDDMAEERRAELRARYEAKAAKVLRALDQRRDEIGEAPATPAPPPARRRAAPWGAVGLVVIAAGIAATLGGWVLPRVGQNATVTSFFEEDLAAATEVRDLRRATEEDPSAATWTALGDAYWAAEDAEEAREAYAAAVEGFDDAPARAYQRLGFLALQEDVERARVLLEQARLRGSEDPNTLGTLGELYLQAGDFVASLEAFEALAANPAAGQDPLVQERLALLRQVAPLAEQAEAEPDAETLTALGEALWRADARNAAARRYFRVITEFDPGHPRALARVGELLFLDGRTADAMEVLDRARQSAGQREATLPDNALLFLGNAAFAQEAWDLAIDAWQQHLDASDAPGRVPQLIEQARALRDGTAEAGAADVALPGTAAGGAAGAAPGMPPGGEATVQASADGAALYQQYCAACHGPNGGGGSGPRLAGNRNAGRPGNVESLIRVGRGTMPGFAGQLSDAQVETLRDWVVASYGP